MSKTPPNTKLRIAINQAINSIPIKPDNVIYPNMPEDMANKKKVLPYMQVIPGGSVVTEELVDGSIKQMLIQLDIYVGLGGDNQRLMDKYIDSVQSHFAEDNQVGEFTSVASPETLTPERNNDFYSETISFNVEYFVEY